MFWIWLLQYAPLFLFCDAFSTLILFLWCDILNMICYYWSSPILSTPIVLLYSVPSSFFTCLHYYPLLSDILIPFRSVWSVSNLLNSDHSTHDPLWLLFSVIINRIVSSWIVSFWIIFLIYSLSFSPLVPLNSLNNVRLRLTFF